MKTILTTGATFGALHYSQVARKVPVKPWIIDTVEVAGGFALARMKFKKDGVTPYTQGVGAGLFLDGLTDLIDRYVPQL